MKKRSIGSELIIYSVLAGLLSGALFAGVFRGDWLAGLCMFLSPLPVLMVGLSFGFLPAVASGIVACLLIPLLAFGGAGVFYLLCDLVPSLVVLYLLLKHRTVGGKVVWYPVGYTLSWLGVVAALVALSVVAVIVVGFNEVVVSGLAAASANNAEAEKVVAALPVTAGDYDIEATLKLLMLKSLSVSLPQQIDPKVVEVALARLVPLFMASIAGLLFVHIASLLFLAEFALLKIGKSLRPKADFSGIYVQNWVLVFLLICAAVGFWGSGNLGYISRNFAICMLLPFCVLGLAMVHVWAKRTKYAWLLLTVFYLLLTVSFIMGIGTLEVFGALIVIGLCEQIFRLYKVIIQKKKERK